MLAEREVGLAIILGIFNTVNESDHETKWTPRVKH